MASFVSRCRAPANIRRALFTALIVGPILTAINQTSVVAGALAGETISSVAAVRIGLTFAVPFLVSLTSAALADSRTF